MSLENLTQLANAAYEHCKKRIAEGGEVQPHVVFKTPNGEFGMILVPDYGNPATKTQSILTIRTELRKLKATDYVFVFEAWVSKGTPQGIFRGMPRDNPDRLEELSVVGGDNKGLVKGWMAEIKTVMTKRHLGALAAMPPEMEIAGAGASFLFDKTAN